MALKIKRIHITETMDNLSTRLPLYLTDEFHIWHYAILDEDTVLVISPDSCQVQTFDETFNSKYSVDFDELGVCDGIEFNDVYNQVRESLLQADLKYRTSISVAKPSFAEFFIENSDHLRAAS